MEHASKPGRDHVRGDAPLSSSPQRRRCSSLAHGLSITPTLRSRAIAAASLFQTPICIQQGAQPGQRIGGDGDDRRHILRPAEEVGHVGIGRGLVKVRQHPLFEERLAGVPRISGPPIPAGMCRNPPMPGRPTCVWRAMQAPQRKRRPISRSGASRGTRDSETVQRCSDQLHHPSNVRHWGIDCTLCANS